MNTARNIKKLILNFLCVSFLVSGIGSLCACDTESLLASSQMREEMPYFNAILEAWGTELEETFEVPVDWSFPGEDDNTIFLMHTFRFLDTTFLEWYDTCDSELEDLIVAYIRDYLHYGTDRTKDVYYAWSDDSVARRVFRLSYWGYLFQKQFSEEDLTLLKGVLEEQAELLTQDSFYNYNHNHGMYQDIGLIAYALFWEPDDEVRAEYLELARTRSEAYFDYVFTEEGVHKEHSPRYGYDVAAYCLPFYAEVYRTIDANFSQKCEQLYLNCGDYFAALTMPNGVVPSIGDSAEFSIDTKYWTENLGYQWVATGGEFGVCPPEDRVFTESGYATFRSLWTDDPEEATYLLFSAATYSSTHKHSDDLSFILYHGGELFVEAGRKDYNYTDEQTSYTYSNYGHNVMLVNAEGFPVTYAVSGAQRIASTEMETACATQITSYDTEAEVKWVQGVQYRYPNATQVRTIAYDKAQGVVQITDTVEAVEELQTQFLYHIASGVEIQEHDTGWSLIRDGVTTANVYVSSEQPIKLETITGSAGTAPYYTTYYNSSGMQEGSLLIVTMDCEKGGNELCFTVELSPESDFAADIPACAIDKESPSAVIREIPARPYGAYYISTRLDENVLSVENTYIQVDSTYAWEIFNEDKTTRIAYGSYSESRIWDYVFEEAGTYYIKAWIKNSAGEKLRTFSRPIVVSIE